ncbi:MAG: hypothetical protein JW810_06565 [Sedimentisphaerales bacterium]|nr:hypothetical protein [Sedimentisphaerales bacterium]
MTILFVIPLGCSSNENNGPAKIWRSQYHPYQLPTSGVFDSGFLFSRQFSKSQAAGLTASEQFGRRPWPVSPEAVRIISPSETVIYDQFFFDDQYVTANQLPRSYYHRRTRGYRVDGGWSYGGK